MDSRQPALIHDCDAICKPLGEVHLVRYDDHCQSIGRQLPHDLQNPVLKSRSSADVGSSKINTSRCIASSRAIAPRCR